MGDSVLAEVCWEVCLGQPRVTRHICLVVSSPDSRPERGVATVAQSGFLLCPDVNRLGVLRCRQNATNPIEGCDKKRGV